MYSVKVFCPECGEETLEEAGECVVCGNTTNGKVAHKSWDVPSEYDISGDGEYYESGEFYDGELPVPEHVKEVWYEAETTNVAMMVPITLNTLIDAQGRTSLKGYIEKVSGVKLRDISYALSWEETLLLHTATENGESEASSNTIVMEVEGLLSYD